MAKDIPMKLVELLAAFNSKTYELVLGAGGMHFSGFDLIKTTHLTLAAQCLHLIVTQIRPIQMAVVCLTSNDDAVEKFEHVITEYENHRRDIFSKLVSQIRKLAFQSLSNLADFPWAQEGFRSRPKMRSKSVKVDDCVVEIVEHAKDLHSGLKEFLSTGKNSRRLLGCLKRSGIDIL
eukprot:TRINITY_DN9880_c0_g1_i1.p1 TRINITY_DN9880_c0_g1~~TRINITY_DN9880_c0_g1_i1.p1  ORF type:complete len:197 (+),score=47.31 TRINITY_DN9880_c0_g1_i1:61-591(+)